MKHNPTSKKTSSLGYLFPSGVFYSRHARDFNYELNEEELIKEALKRGFITAPLRGHPMTSVRCISTIRTTSLLLQRM